MILLSRLDGTHTSYPGPPTVIFIAMYRAVIVFSSTSVPDPASSDSLSFSAAVSPYPYTPLSVSITPAGRPSCFSLSFFMT